MTPPDTPVPYSRLVDITDKLLADSDDNEDRLARGLQALDPDIRNELLVSDLLNAYQVFYYFFRIIPDELVKERMELEPASALVSGLKINEIDLLELIFIVRDAKPIIIVSDGEKAVATFTGREAYTNGMDDMENLDKGS